MICFLKLVAKLTGRKVVALIDHDSEVTFRIAIPIGESLVAYRWGCSSGPCILRDEGVVQGPSYVVRWEAL